jgi:DNA polymerase I-like protein with 3'-5' exonuclease and polymerase domains
MSAEYFRKVLKSLTFQCQATACPKHQDSYNAFLLKDAEPKITDHFKWKGCMQFRTFVYGIAPSAVGEDDWNKAPLIAAIFPSPDPTGAQGICNGTGFSLDVLLDSIFAANPQGPTRVAVMFLTRGYSFQRVQSREIQQYPVSRAAIAHCYPYLEQDILALKPSKVLLCGFEPGNSFFSSQTFTIPEFRRRNGLTIKVGTKTFPAQVTYFPHTVASVPSLMKCIQEDCRKLFQEPVTFQGGKSRILRNLDEAVEYLDFLTHFEGFIAFDTETENLNRKAPNKLGTLQFATDTSEGVLLPYQHKETPFDAQELQVLEKRLKRLFGKPIAAQGWVGHNLKFENTILWKHFGCYLDSAPLYDTMAMAYLLDETHSERKMDYPNGFYTLKVLARDLLNFDGYDKGILAVRSEGELLDLPLEQLASYANMDAYVTMALFERLQELAAEQGYLKKLMKLAKLYYGPVTKLTAHLETQGFRVDLKNLRHLAADKGPFETRLREIEEELKAFPVFRDTNLALVKEKNAGHTLGVLGKVPWVLDFSKPAVKERLFFTEMGLPPVSWSTKTGRPSIDDEFFEAYGNSEKSGEDYHAEVDLFGRYEEVKKMRDSFITKMLERVDPETGDPDSRLDQRIRPNYHYSQLVTGRWAVSNPNTQQVPKSEEGAKEGAFLIKKAVKDCFTVDPGHGLIQIDYKVNEVRWAATMAKDAAMCQIFVEAFELLKQARERDDIDLLKKAELYEDIHKGTASKMFGIAREEVTKKQRTIAKTITFGLMFGQGVKALSETLKISEEEAETHMAKFFSEMKGIDAYIKKVQNDAQLKGYVEAPHGRRRRFWGVKLPKSCPSRRRWIARNLRQAFNSPVQGSASDGAMYGGACSLLEHIRANNKSWIIQNAVHDSVILQVPENEIVECIEVAEQLMVVEAMRKMQELGFEFYLPLGVDVEVGIKWGTLTKWSGTKSSAAELQEMVKAYWRER